MASIGPKLPPHLLNLQESSGSGEDKGNCTVGPQIPPELVNRPPPKDDSKEEDDDDDYVPALPPDLLAARSGAFSSSSATAGPSKKVVGPSLPPSYPITYGQGQYEDDSDDDVGPKPLPVGMKSQEADGVRQFMEKEEKRRKEVEEAAKPKALKRDEWMLVPPTSSDLLGTLDPTKLKARQFARTAAPAKKVDNSLWTETPAERQQRIADEVSGKKKRAANADDSVGAEETLEARKKQRLDEEIRRGVEEHTRKVRGSTLIDVHSKTSKKEEDPKSNAIWDHGRDMSLGGRLMDDNTRNKMLRDAKGLGDRFGTGKSGGFL